MPYVITTGIQTVDCDTTTSDSYAVETLEDAREIAFDLMADIPRYALADAAHISAAIHALTKDGGSIRLPHNRVIDVTPTTWRELARDAGEGHRARHVEGAWSRSHLAMHRRAVLDAYNEGYTSA